MKGLTIHIIICLIFLFLNILFSECIHAQNTNVETKADSLYHILKHEKTPQKRISIFRELSDMHWQQPKEVIYLNEIITIATQLDSSAVVYDAMANLSRYYFNINKPDSFMYWVDQIDTLANRRNELPDAVFMAGNLVCLNHIQSGNYEQAMDEAIRQLNAAEQKHQEYGLMRANHNLGIIYQVINRDSDALVAFREGLIWLKKNGDRPRFKLQYLADMVIPALKLNLFDESESLLKQYKTVLHKLEHTYNENGTVYPIKEHKWTLNSYFTELYIRQNQLEKAKIYLDEAIYYDSILGNKLPNYPYCQAKALYYKKTGNNKQALEAINHALAIEYKPDMLKMKVDVLRTDGKTDEALATYDDLLKLNASINDEAFSRQIDQLRTLNDLNQQEKQARELKYQKEQIEVKEHQLVNVLSASVVLSVLLYIMWLFYKRTQRLKNELISDKESLIKSEKELRIAKEKAVDANHTKTGFISNISHEIRTPLNAIVGFSELLTEDIYEETEKQQFASIINNNSELLLTLVNNILDLSRLESNTTGFIIKPCDLVDCCRKTLTSIKHKVNKNTNLTFSPAKETFILNTDAYRVQQLLTNLLLNAVKFTKSGEINLSFIIDEKNNQVCLAVTDTGCGIPHEMQSRIFSPFEKLDDFQQGTGLGLPICQTIASRLNGSIYLDSGYKNGARFVFTHPLTINIQQKLIPDITSVLR